MRELNRMVKTEDGKLYCPAEGQNCGPDNAIEDHVHSWEVQNLLIDHCVITGCHEQRYA